MQFESSMQATGTSLLEEIFMEAFSEKELLILELSIPGQEYEFDFGGELDDIGKRIENCLKGKAIPGIKQTTVTRSEDAEIIMELDYLVAPQVTINQRRGNRYRDAIGKALQSCLDFDTVRVEGASGVNNRFATDKSSDDDCKGPRYVDIRVTDKATGKQVNIEIKRGKSRYHKCQRKKDAHLAAAGRGQTYVIRGTPKRKGRELEL